MCSDIRLTGPRRGCLEAVPLGVHVPWSRQIMSVGGRRRGILGRGTHGGMLRLCPCIKPAIGLLLRLRVRCGLSSFRP